MSGPGHPYTLHSCPFAGVTRNVYIGQRCPECHQLVDAPDAQSILAPPYYHYPRQGYPLHHTGPEGHPTGGQYHGRQSEMDNHRETIGFGQPQPNGSYHPYYEYPTREPAASSYGLPARLDYTGGGLNGVPEVHQHYASGLGEQDNSESKFPCEICKEAGVLTALGRDADLRRHKDSVHIKEKTWFCPIESCNRHDKDPFTRKDHMQSHVQNVHSDKPATKREGRKKKGANRKKHKDRMKREDDSDTDV